jgi:hypothetical protein
VKTVLDGDMDKAVKLLIAHYQATADIILADSTVFAGSE